MRQLMHHTVADDENGLPRALKSAGDPSSLISNAADRAPYFLSSAVNPAPAESTTDLDADLRLRS
jgi:hypothetical protein